MPSSFRQTCILHTCVCVFSKYLVHKLNTQEWLVWIYYLDLDQCPHLSCYHNVSTIVTFSLLQVFINTSSFLGISNWTLYVVSRVMNEIFIEIILTKKSIILISIQPLWIKCYSSSLCFSLGFCKLVNSCKRGFVNYL